MSTIPPELLEQVERGNTLLFVGERILRATDGQAIFDQLTRDLAIRGNLAGSEEYTFPEVTQAYEEDQGRQALVQFVRNRLDEFGGDEPQEIHRLIAGLTPCSIFITTCFDRRLELAFEQSKRALDVITSNVDVAFEDGNKVQLYKLRGSLDRPDTLVLTEDDYETFFEDQSSISVVLQSYLARKTILFLGYDLADPAFKRLYRKVTHPLDDFTRRAYATGVTLSPSVTRWSRRNAIRVIEADPVDFLHSLVSELADRVRPTIPAPTPATEQVSRPLPESPYKLLDFYEPEDAEIFFGRQQETELLTALIHAHRLVLLHGASGVGKTSLLLAGAVLRLEGADPPYECIYVRALEDPAQAMRKMLRRHLVGVRLPEEGSLLDFLDAAVKSLGRPLVILLDQFEEFFTRLSPQIRAAFVSELGDLYDARNVPIKIVLSLREDWLASIDEIEKRIPEVFRIRMRLLPLQHNQARDAITRPVERLGIRYEPALVDRILEDLVRDDANTVMPPQLQLVCSALFRQQATDVRIITRSSYDKLGGARGVLKQYLEDELLRFVPLERALARTLLETLITSQNTRRVTSWSELCQEIRAPSDVIKETLEKLVRARLVRAVQSSALDEASYELAHEYLIEHIVLSPEVRERKEVEELLRQGTENWKRFGTLVSEDTLALIETRQHLLKLTPSHIQLLQMSKARHAKRSVRLLLSVMGGLLGGAVGGALGTIAKLALQAPQTPSAYSQAAQVAGNSIAGALIGGLLGLVIALGQIARPQRLAPTILGGIIVGLLLGNPIDVFLTTEPSTSVPLQLLGGAVFGGGISACVVLGARVLSIGLRILFWAVLGGIVGFLATLVAGPIELTWLPILIASGITTGIGLAGVRLQSTEVKRPA